MNKFIGNCESRPDAKGRDCENISPPEADDSNHSLRIHSREARWQKQDCKSCGPFGSGLQIPTSQGAININV